LRRKDQGAAVCGHGNSDQPTTAMAVAVAGNGGRSRGSTRADKSQPKSGSIAADTVLVAAEMAAAVAVAAAMATVAMVATMCQPWQQ